jgi:hypothetical protein
LKKKILLILACVLICGQRGYAATPQIHQESDTCNRYGTQPVIPYHIARKEKIKENEILLLNVSIDPKDMDRNNLLALACALGKGYPREAALAVYIFDNNHFAKSFDPEGERNSGGTYRSICGLYRFVRTGQVTGQEMFLRSDPKSPYFDTRIDLGPPPK